MKREMPQFSNAPKRLRKLLAAANITQVEAAKRLKIDPRTMRRYLSDKETSRASHAVVTLIETMTQRKHVLDR